MGYTANTKFVLCKSDRYDAGFWFEGNIVEVGKETITLETLIHEISELETMKVLDELRDMKINVNGFLNFVAHFVSPYGKNSFLHPCLELEGRPESETFLEE